MDVKCTVQQITQKKENHHQAKDVAVTIMNVITSVMVANQMLEFMQKERCRMIAKICDICEKVETTEKRKWKRLKNNKNFYVCHECMALIKELKAKLKEGEQE